MRKKKAATVALNVDTPPLPQPFVAPELLSFRQTLEAIMETQKPIPKAANPVERRKRLLAELGLVTPQIEREGHYGLYIKKRIDALLKPENALTATQKEIKASLSTVSGMRYFASQLGYPATYRTPYEYGKSEETLRDRFIRLGLEELGVELNPASASSELTPFQQTIKAVLETQQNFASGGDATALRKEQLEKLGITAGNVNRDFRYTPEMIEKLQALIMPAEQLTNREIGMRDAFGSVEGLRHLASELGFSSEFKTPERPEENEETSQDKFIREGITHFRGIGLFSLRRALPPVEERPSPAVTLNGAEVDHCSAPEPERRISENTNNTVPGTQVEKLKFRIAQAQLRKELTPARLTEKPVVPEYFTNEMARRAKKILEQTVMKYKRIINNPLLEHVSRGQERLPVENPCSPALLCSAIEEIKTFAEGNLDIYSRYSLAEFKEKIPHWEQVLGGFDSIEPLLDEYAKSGVRDRVLEEKLVLAVLEPSLGFLEKQMKGLLREKTGQYARA